MATITKNFKIKNGLIVEGSTATVNGNDILTKSASDTTYIQGLVGGVANSESVANAIVLRDANASFAANVVTADLVGDVTGTVSDISNHDTDALAEGTTNLYFTAQRAIDGSLGNSGGSVLSTYLTNLNSGGTAYIDVNTTALDALYDASGAAANAQSAAETYADGVADTAQTNAQNYADGVADTAQTNAQNYTDGVVSALDTMDIPENIGATNLWFTDDRARTAVVGLTPSASTYLSDSGSGYIDINTTALGALYDAAGSADTAQTNAVTIANAYTDDAVANLVNGAPELLDTLNELAAALDDNPNVIADLQGIAAGKQDALTAGTGIDITGNTISADLPGLVIGSPYLTTEEDMLSGTVLTLRIDQLEAQLDTDGYLTSSDLSGYATETYADTSASTAQTNAQNYTDGQIGSLDSGNTVRMQIDQAADTAQTNAQNYTDGQIGSLDSGNTVRMQIDQAADTAQTNAQNYTDGQIGSLDSGNTVRMQIDQAADTAQTNAQNYADNAINALTTDDIEEGSSNLYFSNALAVSALEAVTPNFQSVDITWVRREEATWTDANTAGAHTAHTFLSSEGSVKYLVRIFNNGDSQVSEVLVTTDSSNNIAVTEYAIIYTSENPLATITADYDPTSSEYRLRVTTANNNSEILVAATMLAYND